MKDSVEKLKEVRSGRLNNGNEQEISSSDINESHKSDAKSLNSSGAVDISRSIVLSVKTQPVESESNTMSGIFAFSYTITILHVPSEDVGCYMADDVESSLENNSGEVQLINRHWKVFSLNRQIADVKGEGVVGQMPVLRPGDSFEYTSWTVLPDPTGYMEGTFTFRSSKGCFFDVRVPPFIFDYRDRSNVH
ncbi:MAG TPA: ApaG domain [Oligoflexia bacterium]|nr:ApaG domain [Oligoflexia bacterium]HMP47651.1 ApaG domain [Oligoflexia bacterium]